MDTCLWLLDGIVRRMRELWNRIIAQMDHKKWYACAIASSQVSVVALNFLIKLDGIVEGIVEWW